MTVDFSREEWQDLDSAQRCLYQDVTLETYSHLCTVGNQVPKPAVIFKLEQGEGPWTLEEETPHHSCSDYIMRNAGLEETQAGIKIAGRNINHLRYADDTTLMAESEKELKSL
ncbi:zinc finger protein 81-like [Ovis aries]|uniref:zinc finger protein 81-like n=1 Tax=Ovis aries TaxID=9940 RepID=UPI00100FBF01|nr:zinc finger protein 81-like [Ovis aries]